MTYDTEMEPKTETQEAPTEDAIRLRSYQIWEREGRPDGRDREHWMRAKAELEAELQEATMAGKATNIVLPRLPISSPPTKAIAPRIEVSTFPLNGADAPLTGTDGHR